MRELLNHLLEDANLDSIVKMQKEEADKPDASDYMVGLYNGLAVAKATIDNEEVELLDIKENTNVSYDYSSTQIQVPNEIAEGILRFGLGIPNEEIYDSFEGDGGNKYGRELDCHITIKYGLITTDPSEVGKLTNDDWGKIEVELGKVSIFSEEDKPYDVVKIDVNSEDLIKLHDLFSQLENKDTYPEYKPHLTIAYVKKGEGQKYVGNHTFEKMHFIVNSFIFSGSNDVKTKIDLNK